MLGIGQRFRMLTFRLMVTLMTNIYVCKCENYVTKVTRYGRITGISDEVYSGKYVEKYLGIPYAEPPIGHLRLEPPVPVRPWNDEILRTTELPPACPQPAEGVYYIEYHVPGFNSTSEDCLYLNIYTPRNHRTASLPVLFFVHGGSYFNGMGGMFDGAAMAAEGTVVVTMNYRLGPLGFLSAGDSKIPGNYGMLDQVAALRWVKDNIGDFGGDPHRVTIDGHSAGGCSAGLLMMSPMTKGLFRKVIIQSGSPLAHWSVTRRNQGPDVHFKVFASSLGCLSNNSLQIKRCLQGISTENMHRHISQNYVTSPSLSPQFRPVVDGHFLTDTPEWLMEHGDFTVEQVLTGATQDEGLMAAMPLIEAFGGSDNGIRQLLTLMYCFRGDLPDIPNIVDVVLDLYTSWPFLDMKDAVEKIFSEIVGDYFITAPTHRMAQILTSRNISVYVYNYEYKSIFAQWKGVIHGSELFYLSGFPLTGHTNFRYDERDKKTANVLLRLWSSFLKTGVPTLQPHREFSMRPYSPLRPQYVRIYQGNSHPYLEHALNFKTTKTDFWNRRVPSLMQKHKSTGEYPYSEVVTKNYVITGPDSWALIATCICLSVLVVFFLVGYCKMRKRIQKLTRQSSTHVITDINKKDYLLKKDNSKYPRVNI
ncbi:hypothetical protein FSP39_021543 [Pinctada imbricata]|uniref:Carboxylic ester hydrolase n=1 Tax=Pinctada imbricata TaxID=66713 RepID=A0AA89BRQ8_PINIB|nr:hypothetical protein FSP39_021543 [Pinctada imbricata]